MERLLSEQCQINEDDPEPVSLKEPQEIPADSSKVRPIPMLRMAVREKAIRPPSPRPVRRKIPSR